MQDAVFISIKDDIIHNQVFVSAYYNFRLTFEKSFLRNLENVKNEDISIKKQSVEWDISNAQQIQT